MVRKFWVIIVLSLAFILALSACTRPASVAPQSTATSESDFPFPLPTSNPLQNILSGTQTAQAKGGVPSPTTNSTPAAPSPTSEVIVLPTSTSIPVLPAATATPNLPVATWSPTPGVPSTYTIQEGEYPFCLARRFNVDAGELLSINGLTMTSKPAAGTTVKIPTSGKTWAGERARIAHPATYTVQAGDTVNSIACDYGDVDPNAIITVNNLQSPYTLTAGQVLQIP